MEWSNRDRYGIGLQVSPLGDEALVAAEDDTQITDAVLTRGDVIELRDRLTAWLDGGTAPAAPAPLTAADVRAIASQVAAEVVALHMAPQARLSDAVAARLCTVPDCKKFPGVSEHFEHDVEPRCDGTACCSPHPLDIDPPEPEAGRESVDTSWSDQLWNGPTPVRCTIQVPASALLTDKCAMCGHLWMIHQRAPKQLVGCECGHRTSTHLLSSGCAINECECTRTYPSAP